MENIKYFLALLVRHCHAVAWIAAAAVAAVLALGLIRRAQAEGALAVAVTESNAVAAIPPVCYALVVLYRMQEPTPWHQILGRQSHRMSPAVKIPAPPPPFPLPAEIPAMVVPPQQAVASSHHRTPALHTRIPAAVLEYIESAARSGLHTLRLGRARAGTIAAAHDHSSTGLPLPRLLEKQSFHIPWVLRWTCPLFLKMRSVHWSGGCLEQIRGRTIVRSPIHLPFLHPLPRHPRSIPHPNPEMSASRTGASCEKMRSSYPARSDEDSFPGDGPAAGPASYCGSHGARPSCHSLNK